MRSKLVDDVAKQPEVQPIHLRVRRHGEARIARRIERSKGGFVAARVAAQEIVHRCGPVDGDADGDEPGIAESRGTRSRERAAAGLHADANAATGEVADDLVEVGTEVGFASNEADLAAAEVSEARGDGEHFGRGELARSCVAGAGTAVLAGLIAFRRELPHRENGPRDLVTGLEVARLRHASRLREIP